MISFLTHRHTSKIPLKHLYDIHTQKQDLSEAHLRYPHSLTLVPERILISQTQHDNSKLEHL
jgi:hypothetical protein